jgi:hypothetical protein
MGILGEEGGEGAQTYLHINFMLIDRTRGCHFITNVRVALFVQKIIV